MCSTPHSTSPCTFTPDWGCLSSTPCTPFPRKEWNVSLKYCLIWFVIFWFSHFITAQTAIPTNPNHSHRSACVYLLLDFWTFGLLEARQTTCHLTPPPTRKMQCLRLFFGWKMREENSNSKCEECVCVCHVCFLFLCFCKNVFFTETQKTAIHRKVRGGVPPLSRAKGFGGSRQPSAVGGETCSLLGRRGGAGEGRLPWERGLSEGMRMKSRGDRKKRTEKLRSVSPAVLQNKIAPLPNFFHTAL